MANAVLCCSALLVLAGLLPHSVCAGADDSAANVPQPGHARETSMADPREDFKNGGQGGDWRDNSWHSLPKGTVAPAMAGFLANTNPKNKAIVTGVVAGAAVSAVAGGIAIAIEESKIHERIKEGLPVKPLFPWLVPKGQKGKSQPVRIPPALKAKQAETTDKPTKAPTTTVATTKPPTTTQKPVAGAAIPLPVWIALGVLVCCCCVALIAAVVDCVVNGGRGKKRAVKKKGAPDMERDMPRERSLSRSDSVSSYDSYADSYYSDYTDNSPSYAAVAPQDVQYYKGGSVGYTYEYPQAGAYSAQGYPVNQQRGY